MKFTGETAVRLAEKYGLPIQKHPNEHEGYRADIPLEDAQAILRDGDPRWIFVEAEEELVEQLNDDLSVNKGEL